MDKLDLLTTKFNTELIKQNGNRVYGSMKSFGKTTDFEADIDSNGDLQGSDSIYVEYYYLTSNYLVRGYFTNKSTIFLKVIFDYSELQTGSTPSYTADATLKREANQ